MNFQKVSNKEFVIQRKYPISALLINVEILILILKTISSCVENIRKIIFAKKQVLNITTELWNVQLGAAKTSSSTC